MSFPDVMVDIETTGLSPDHSGIIQLSAVKFNLAERTVDPVVFNRGLILPPDRYWDESTRDWWLRDKRDLLMKILSTAEPAGEVLQRFQAWVAGSPTFWSKPTHFDYTMLQSYFRSHGMIMPLHFRPANDMNSFLRGAFFPEPVPKVEVELEGDAHDAIYDCFWQISCLFKTLDLKNG